MTPRDALRRLLLKAAQEAVQVPLTGENLPPPVLAPGAPWAEVHLLLGPEYPITLGEGGSNGISGFMQVDLHFSRTKEGQLEAQTVKALAVLHVGRRLTDGTTLVDLSAHGRIRMVPDGRIASGLLRSLTVYWTGRLIR